MHHKLQQQMHNHKVGRPQSTNKLNLQNKSTHPQKGMIMGHNKQIIEIQPNMDYEIQETKAAETNVDS